MKKLFPIIIIILLAISACWYGGADKASANQNEQVIALQNVHKNFLTLSQKVNTISADLSDAEKQRAAFFLVSAYSLVIECYLERGNAAEPAITEWMFPPRKFGGDNPYTIYSQVPVNPMYSYCLSGKRGSAIYLGVQMYGFAQGFNLATANLSLDDIVFNADGTFDIHISKTRPEGAKNWLQLTDGDHAFLVRQYFSNPANRVPAELNIKRTDDNPKISSTYLERIERADSMLTQYIMGEIDIADLLQKTAMNRYPSKDAEVRKPKYGGALYPTKDNKYDGCWVKLSKGEAMRVHGRLPENTLYASYVFYDRWYNTPSYPQVDCFRTMENIILNPDGTFDLYISPEEIKHPNWINTGGLYEGSFSSRYMLSKETVFPSLEVVKISDIKAFSSEVTVAKL